MPTKNEDQRVFLNAYYTENKIERQSYDLVFPRKAAGCLGLVLCIHGGAWTAGTKDAYTSSLFQVSEEKGVAAACINYRFLSEAVTFADILDDISSALAAIKAKGAEYGVHFDRVLLTGISAGAHLSLLYAYTKKDTAPIEPVCVVEICGPTDFENTFFYSPENRLNAPEEVDDLCTIIGRGIGCDIDAADAKEAMRKYSPIRFVDENTVPTVFGHGEQDNIVPYGNALDLHIRLDACHAKHTFISFPNSGHGCEDKASMHKLMQLFFECIDTYLKEDNS